MKRRKQHNGFPSYIPITLLFAIFLFCVGCRTDGSFFTTALSSLGQNQKFVTDAVALELGVLPKLSLDNPSVKTSEDESASENTTVDDALLAESSYVPSTQTSESSKYGTPDSNYPAKELSITKRTGSNCLNTEGVYLQNQSGLSVDLNQMLKNPYKINLDLNGKPEVLILHTHTTEAYTPDSVYSFKPEDNDHTTNTNYTVVQVGNEITSVLQNMGIGVIHYTDILDRPSYTDSYNRSMSVINQELKKNPSIKVVLDVHRDAMIASDGTKYKVVTTIDGQKCAQVMLVMGTNAGGLTHDNWRTNLNFAVNLQKNINASYSGLMRPVDLRKQRFNEQATTGSMLLEVGTSGNTLSEALVSARYVAKILGQTLLSST